jgi:CHAT domain-containing protein
VEQYLKSGHLLIIPDGDLYYIPFEALLSGTPAKNERANYSTLPYLIRKYSVSYSYSAGMSLIRRRTNGARMKYSFVGFAPVFSDSARNNGMLSSGNLHKDPKEIFANVRSISMDGRKYNELPYTKTEVDGIARLFEKKHLRHATRLFADANKDNFMRIVGEYNCIHIASHSYANEEHPERSGLLFSPLKDTASWDDGVMSEGETYDLKMDAELVVLSSCESGIGELVKGEGLMALTRGFFYSGARNIVFSLWKVPDKHTSDLMTAFYGFLLSGENMPSAMRKAKLKMIDDPLSAFPSKWTGFVLLSSN